MKNKDMEILSVSLNKKLYHVTYTDGSFDCTADDIVNYRLIKGKHFTSEEIESIINAVALSKYYLDAINYASYRVRSEQEFVEYLRKKGLSSTDIASIITKLTDNHYIDDYAFGCIFAKKYYNMGKGNRHIRQILKQKGLSDHHINQIIDDCHFDYADIINQQINKLVKTYHTYPVSIQKQKITQKLLRDGYDYEEINRELDQITWHSDEKDRLEKEIDKLKKKGFDQFTIRSKLLNKGYSRTMIDNCLK